MKVIQQSNFNKEDIKTLEVFTHDSNYKSNPELNITLQFHLTVSKEIVLVVPDGFEYGFPENMEMKCSHMITNSPKWMLFKQIHIHKGGLWYDVSTY